MGIYRCAFLMEKNCTYEGCFPRHSSTYIHIFIVELPSLKITHRYFAAHLQQFSGTWLTPLSDEYMIQQCQCVNANPKCFLFFYKKIFKDSELSRMLKHIITWTNHILHINDKLITSFAYKSHNYRSTTRDCTWISLIWNHKHGFGFHKISHQVYNIYIFMNIQMEISTHRHQYFCWAANEFL